MATTPSRRSSGAHNIASLESCQALEREIAALKADTARQLAECTAFCEVADVTIRTAEREAADLGAVLTGGPGGEPVSGEQVLWALTSTTQAKDALVERMHRRCRRLHADLLRLEKRVGAHTTEAQARGHCVLVWVKPA